MAHGRIYYKQRTSVSLVSLEQELRRGEGTLVCLSL